MMFNGFKARILLSILLGVVVFSSAASTSGMLYVKAIQSIEASQQCKDVDDKISYKGDVSESGEVCNIKVSEDFPTMRLCPC